jgi:hypothetical protein
VEHVTVLEKTLWVIVLVASASNIVLCLNVLYLRAVNNRLRRVLEERGGGSGVESRGRVVRKGRAGGDDAEESHADRVPCILAREVLPE